MQGTHYVLDCDARLSSCSHRDRDVHLLLPFAGVDVPAPALGRRMKHSVGFMHHEPHVARAAVRRQAKVGEGFRCGCVGDADLQHLARLFGRSDRPS